MDYEKKYKEALERARVWKDKSGMPADKQGILDDIFPELKESEDERIRKGIKSILEHYKESGEVVCPYPFVSIEEALAWLEKQGEVESDNDDIEVEEKGIRKAFNKIWDEKQDKQKSQRMISAEAKEAMYDKTADTVEPKFIVGDWITNGDYTWKIAEVKPLDYILQSQDGNVVDYSIFHADEQFHSFTIQDARDGDVLASNKSIFIFQEEYIGEKPIAYCGLMNGLFIEGNDACWTNEKCYPATKEQRNLLFRKMKEAGYEWDDEKKELKKVENKNYLLSDFFKAEYERGKADVLKSIAWSDEDEDLLFWTINNLTELKNRYGKNYGKSGKCIDWLKSLKQRMGG